MTDVSISFARELSNDQHHVSHSNDTVITRRKKRLAPIVGPICSDIPVPAEALKRVAAMDARRARREAKLAAMALPR